MIDEFADFTVAHVFTSYSALPCRVCGWRHQLDAFKPGQRVRVLEQHRDSIHSPADFVGCVGTVLEWSQYGGPVYVRVAFDDGGRENFDPCELEHEIEHPIAPLA